MNASHAEQRAALFKLTANFPFELEAVCRGVCKSHLQRRLGNDFSLHEHVWHLADLESEAFALRIRALLEGSEATLSNFDGDAVAARRNYHDLPLHLAVRSFAEARLQNLWFLSGASAADWKRCAFLEGVGIISLQQLFRAMSQHDQAHMSQMRALRCSFNRELTNADWLWRSQPSEHAMVIAA